MSSLVVLYNTGCMHALHVCMCSTKVQVVTRSYRNYKFTSVRQRIYTYIIVIITSAKLKEVESQEAEAADRCQKEVPSLTTYRAYPRGDLDNLMVLHPPVPSNLKTYLITCMYSVHIIKLTVEYCRLYSALIYSVTQVAKKVRIYLVRLRRKLSQFFCNSRDCIVLYNILSTFVSGRGNRP